MCARLFAVLLGALTCVSLWAQPTISDLKVVPISPYGLIISYTVANATQKDINRGLSLSFEDGYSTYRYKSDELLMENGHHEICWNMAKIGVQSKIPNGSLQVNIDFPTSSCASCCQIQIVAKMNYCVIDLSGGSGSSSYPVYFVADPPQGGFNTEEYKTSKMVLKMVDPGTFTGEYVKGSTTNECTFTLTKPFYIGLFEVTQRQWKLIMGTDPSYLKGDTRPVEQVSYNAIRGSSAGAEWPSSHAVDAGSFLGKLRAKTGIGFDLPTEAQWEYVCRAGAKTTYGYGERADGSYMWYADNADGQTHEVGMTQPNAWGVYDMHGNVAEWCLDWYQELKYSSRIDYEGPSSGTYREVRGGCYGSPADACGASTRTVNASPSRSYAYVGVRIVKSF